MAIEAHEVIVVGGGLVGLTLALALDAHGFEVALIEHMPLDAGLAPGFDQRASAIASASARMLEAIGLGSVLLEHGCPIYEIRVTDGHSPLHLHFDARADGRGGEAGPLGIMVENWRLRAALTEAVARARGVRVIAPAAVASVDRGIASATVTLTDGRALSAPLVVAADGRRSQLRDLAGIRLARWRYDQASVIANIAHAVPHGNIAFELFYPTGPFAILPMLDGEPVGEAGLRHRSAIVWSVRERDAPGVAKLSERAFLAELDRRMQGFLGPLALLSRPVAYPLGFHHADRLVDDRLALVGDAAHAIHPIAGQGLNLGLRDVAALVEVLADARRLGLDIGGSEPLARYQRWRRLDTTMVAAATDGLTRLFAIPGRPAAAIRRLGLAAVNRISPLKSWFMAEARGESGELPKLLTGQLA